MIKFREHRGTLEESMKTEVTLKDREALIAHCLRIFLIPFEPEKLKVEPYDSKPDSRIGWDATYIVTLEGGGVVGFTDNMC